MFFDCLTADLRQLTLKAPYTGLAGVVANDVADRLEIKFDLALLQPVGRNLLGREVLDGDIDLLVFGVTRQTNHLHPVQQGWRDVHRVGGAQEHYVGQVVVDFQVMVVEIVVLLGVEHFEQG